MVILKEPFLGWHSNYEGHFEKSVYWWQCATVMQREA